MLQPVHEVLQSVERLLLPALDVVDVLLQDAGALDHCGAVELALVADSA